MLSKNLLSVEINSLFFKLSNNFISSGYFLRTFEITVLSK
ncbi:hypothetical protein CP02DC21_1649, partial [Chlamydia psittaci 02DC21]